MPRSYAPQFRAMVVRQHGTHPEEAGRRNPEDPTDALAPVAFSVANVSTRAKSSLGRTTRPLPNRSLARFTVASSAPSSSNGSALAAR